MWTIALDIFGGDNAPQSTIEGGIIALKKFSDIKIIMTGDEEKIKECLKQHEYDASRIEIVHAPDIISCHESPVAAVRKKKDSSLVVAMEQVAKKNAQAVVSAGSTGAVLTGGTLIVRRIQGINRPGLAPLMPTVDGGRVMLIDCGANADCSELNLQQFAILGSAYMENVLKIKNPRVGLLNNGEEEEKGSMQSKKVYELLKSTNVNFMGNCEGNDITSGKFDVVVTDGFTGNIALKAIEGTAAMLFKIIKNELMSTLPTKIGAALSKPGFKRVKKRLDASEEGGAILLGVDGGVVKAHGSSNALAIFNAIRQARIFIEGDVVNIVKKAIADQPE